MWHWRQSCGEHTAPPGVQAVGVGSLRTIRLAVKMYRTMRQLACEGTPGEMVGGYNQQVPQPTAVDGRE